MPVLCDNPTSPASTPTSGVTSKPAIEGHFKTGQRTNILDDPFYPAGWRFGNSIFGASPVRFPLI